MTKTARGHENVGSLLKCKFCEFNILRSFRLAVIGVELCACGVPDGEFRWVVRTYAVSCRDRIRIRGLFVTKAVQNLMKYKPDILENSFNQGGRTHGASHIGDLQ